MATAVQLPAPDSGAPLNDTSSFGPASPNGHSHSQSKSASYSNRLTLTEFDLADDRYPSLSSKRSPATPSAHSPTGGFDPAVHAGMTAALRASYERSHSSDPVPPSRAWIGENITQEPAEEWAAAEAEAANPATPREAQSPRADDTTHPSGPPLAHADSYGFDRTHRARPSRDGSGEQRLPYTIPLPQSPADMGQPFSSPRALGDRYDSPAPSSPRHAALASPGGALLSPSASPRHSSVPGAGVGAGAGPSSPSMSPIVPLSAGPTYNAVTMQQIPISPKPRAYPQHPTYITPAASPAMQPSFSPPQVPKEEICVECAMRDQDMADVDVTSPGVWERESDILYEELCRREAEEPPSGRASANGRTSSDNHSRPRAKGGLLTEENLRFWLSINPKEPSSRQQTLDQYVKSQRQLLEAEALARARALRESRMLDEKMRDTFSQLRRSAYELGSSSQPTDDTGVVRLKSPGNAQATHAREVTLLENGMIVEHVDLRREEKEERERRRKEEKRERSRARKSSRSSRSAADVASVYSMPLQSPIPQIDSGFFSGARDSRHSQSFSPRPSSVLTGGGERPQTLLRAQSQASFSDMQSVGSASSPRRSRFFGFKNLSAAWSTRDSVAPSGSMIDMHVALQQEQSYFAAHPSALDIASNTPTLRATQSWPRGETSPEPVASTAPTTKKKNGLKKIWKLVTRSKGASKGASQSKSVDRHEDDMPLAPPPPLSYLVDREGAGRRHVSTPSLLSSMSPNGFSQFAPSPPTAPSSALPSPTSSRYPVLEEKSSGEAHKDQVKQEMEPDHRISAFELGPSNDAGSPDLENRGRTTHSSSKTLSSVGPATPSTSPPNGRPQSTMLSRDKSLPPIPGESTIEFPNPNGLDGRPQTMYDLLQNSSNPMSRGLLPPQAPFRTPDTRRQSFGGMASSPHPAVQSLPSRSPYSRGTVNVPPFLAEEKYAEFGASSPSLTQWNAQAGARAMTTPAKPKKRRSKFGLASLFGKKSLETDRDSQVFAPSATNGSANGSVEPLDYNPYRSSASDQRDEPSFNGYGGPGSAHSSTAPRMSVISKKNIAELVDQDPEFVAYRYPSSDQRLEVLR